MCCARIYPPAAAPGCCRALRQGCGRRDSARAAQPGDPGPGGEEPRCQGRPQVRALAPSTCVVHVGGVTGWCVGAWVWVSCGWVGGRLGGCCGHHGRGCGFLWGTMDVWGECVGSALPGRGSWPAMRGCSGCPSPSGSALFDCEPWVGRAGLPVWIPDGEASAPVAPCSTGIWRFSWGGRTQCEQAPACGLHGGCGKPACPSAMTLACNAPCKPSSMSVRSP